MGRSWGRSMTKGRWVVKSGGYCILRWRGEPMKFAVWMAVGCVAALAQDGAEVFRNQCSTCHRAGSSTSAPLPEALRSLPAETILGALENGKMRAQGSQLSPAERKLVANYLGGTAQAQKIPASASCSSEGKSKTGTEWSGWGADAANSRFQPTAGLTR